MSDYTRERDRQRLRTLRRILTLALKLGDDAGPALRFLAGCPEVAPTAVTVPLQLSPLEQSIVEAIADAGEPLQGKQVATRTGQAYDSTLKVILRNMVDRVILHTTRGAGYTLAQVHTATTAITTDPTADA